jgi:hypothetical protein
MPERLGCIEFGHLPVARVYLSPALLIISTLHVFAKVALSFG